MSDTDSFIEEVSEEVRRDRLFAMMKRYGWIAVMAILLIVGGAAYYEYQKAQREAAAQALGDSIIGALESNDAAVRAEALAGLDVEGAGAQAVVALLTSKEQIAIGEVDAAKATLEAVSNDANAPMAYRQVATFKLLGLSGEDMSAEERRAGYQTLIGGNAQLRLLAEEQLALIDIEEGKREEAVAALQAIVQDSGATAAMRRRGAQLIVALGGELPDSAQDSAQDSAAGAGMGQETDDS